MHHYAPLSAFFPPFCSLLSSFSLVNCCFQMESSSHYVATPSTTLEFEYCESEKVRAHVELSPVLHLRRSVNLSPINVCVSNLYSAPLLTENTW